MSTEVMHTLQEDTQDLQKQLGCMNGFFQLFDRRYLLGQRRHGHHHKKLPQGQSNNNKEFKNASEKLKEKNANNVVKEKHRVSVESSRNSFSSSCSSLDCSKRVQTETSSFCPSIVSEPSSPTSNKKHDLAVPPADIRDVVKDSMTRKPRVVSVKTVAKDGRKGPTMTHVDSPRPLLPHPIPIPYERKDQNLAKLQDLSLLPTRGVKEVYTSRYSYDERESPYKLKSITHIKDYPRLSLDSKQSSVRNRSNAVDQSQSNKRLPSSVVARLMGLEVLKTEPSKIKPSLDDESNSVLRLSRKAVSPALTRIPLEQAPWKQEVKQSQSVYGQIEKRLTEIEFKTSGGKDLRALKQILEAIQRTKMRLENPGHHKSVIEPANAASNTMEITNLHKVKKVNLCSRGHARNRKPTATKATGKTKKPVSPSHTREYLNKDGNFCNSRTLETVSPRLQKSKIKKQSNGKLTASNSTIRDQSCRDNYKTRNISEQGDTVSFPSESDASVASQNEPEVTSSDWAQEHKNKIAERLMGYKSMAEQPSPVSVLDAFYTEDTPSPVKKKLYAFKDDECFDEREWSQMGTDNLASSAELHQLSSGFSYIKDENIKQLVHQIELLDCTIDEATINRHEDINEDHIYIKEILLASGLLKNLDCVTTIAHFHPTGDLINPELFNILEKTKACTSKSKKIKRKMIFDTINNILVQKLTRSASSGLWASKRKVENLNVEQLLEELWLEICNLLANKASDPYDEIINIVSEDVNKRSEDWDHNCYEIPALVLDIERLIFKDLISEIVNAEVFGLQERHARHRRQLFLM